MNVSVSVSNGNQKAVDSMNVSVSVSNSKGTSGKLVVAGYISRKAPNTTPPLFSSRGYPIFFDIVSISWTPMDQLIPHLVIQCGDKHVIPLSQALL